MSRNRVISVVVPTWNRAHLLRDCLRSVLDQDGPRDAFEVLVVDDGSRDHTPDVVAAAQRAAVPALRYIGREHGGLNAARNGGVRAAAGEAICFVDDDELMPKGYLSRLRVLLEENPGVAGFGGPSKEHGGPVPRTCARCSLAAAEVPAEGGLAERLLGGNMTIRRQAFDEVGLFDEELSGRGDETEWFHRARGLPFLYDPELWVWHRREGFSLSQLCRSAFRQGLSLPLYRRKVGVSDTPSLVKAGRYLGHAVKRRCSRGLILASREAGAIVASTAPWVVAKRVGRHEA